MFTVEVIDTLKQAIAAIPSASTEVSRRLYAAHLALDAELPEAKERELAAMAPETAEQKVLRERDEAEKELPQ